MGNTCGCVDPAEKDGEVKVDKNTSQPNQYRKDQINNYRDSTVAKGQTHTRQQPVLDSLPFLFETDDQYLLDLMNKAPSMGLQFIDELAFENGAIYKGYLLNDMRHGPGV